MVHVDGAMWDHLREQDVEAQALLSYLCLLPAES